MTTNTGQKYNFSPGDIVVGGHKNKVWRILEIEEPGPYNHIVILRYIAALDGESIKGVKEHRLDMSYLKPIQQYLAEQRKALNKLEKLTKEL